MSKRSEIKTDLLDQLDRNGVKGKHLVDLVEDYMSLWDIKNDLIADIEDKGVNIKYQNGENQYGFKKNDSVTNLHKTNTQMLKILDHLGLKPSKHEDKEPIVTEM
ncbi:P27 family phage terminase small subunit [Orenia marismortui]|uniref:P27 family predicted phage terminase small subunit n=1 Tax=Orenia marismortui TaxID=46469 RepID=A0A4R8H1R2_9FIRM|nr:P27 family phage terminase small subunit [Orenia marismortui]TDX52149.1 P27 family predicted phage terminase small subunit [Orenia marismortui]